MGKIKVSLILSLFFCALMASKAYASASFMGFDGNRNGYYSSNNWRGNQGYYRNINSNDVNRGECHHKHGENGDSRWDLNHDGHVDRSEWQRREALYEGNNYVPRNYSAYPYNNYNTAYNPTYYGNGYGPTNNYNPSGYYPSNYNPGYAYYPTNGYNSAYNQQAVLQALDRNGDGYISPQEWNGNLNSFNLLDANRNGFLSSGELKSRLAMNVLGGLLNTFMAR